MATMTTHLGAFCHFAAHLETLGQIQAPSASTPFDLDELLVINPPRGYGRD